MKHLFLYRALGWTPPAFAHLPLITNADGNKLSKRQRDATVESYRDRGFFPEALVNFIAHMGGGFEGRDVHRADRVFSLDELAQRFRLDRMTTHSAKVDLERLQHVSRLAIKGRLRDRERSEALLPEVRRLLSEAGVETAYDDDYLVKLLDWAADRITTLQDLTAPHLRFLWSVDQGKDTVARTKDQN